MATNQIKLVINATDNSSTALKALANNINNIKKGVSSLSSDTSSATSGLSSMSSSLGKSPGLFSRITSGAKNALAVFGGFKLVSGIFNTISGAMSGAVSRLDTMDLFERKMKILTGSETDATYALNEMKTATKGTAYGLDTAAKSVQNFVTRGMTTQEATKSVETWMDAVAVYGNGTNEALIQVTNALGKMRSKGTVEMRHINSMINAGINPVQLYAKATNQSAAEVQEQLSAKTLRTEEFLNVVEEALRTGANGVANVTGMAKDMATTWQATFDNMQFALRRGWASLIDGASTLLEALTGTSLKGVFKNFGNSTETFFTAIGDNFKRAGATINTFYDDFLKRHQDAGEIAHNTELINLDIGARIAPDTKEKFKNSFLGVMGNFAEPMATSFLLLANNWAKFKQAVAEGVNSIAPQLGHLFGTILGQGVTSASDLLNKFLEWATLKVPTFFSWVQEKLQWLIDHWGTVVGMANGIFHAFLAWQGLTMAQRGILGINSALLTLNKTLGFFTGGALQIPTLSTATRGLDNYLEKQKELKRGNASTIAANSFRKPLQDSKEKLKSAKTVPVTDILKKAPKEFEQPTQAYPSQSIENLKYRQLKAFEGAEDKIKETKTVSIKDMALNKVPLDKQLDVNKSTYSYNSRMAKETRLRQQKAFKSAADKLKVASTDSLDEFTKVPLDIDKKQYPYNTKVAKDTRFGKQNPLGLKSKSVYMKPLDVKGVNPTLGKNVLDKDFEKSKYAYSSMEAPRSKIAQHKQINRKASDAYMKPIDLKTAKPSTGKDVLGMDFVSQAPAKIEPVTKRIGSMFSNLWTSMTNGFNNFSNLLTMGFSKVGTAVSGFMGKIMDSKIMSSITGFFGDIGTKVGGIGKTIGAGFSTIGETIANTFSSGLLGNVTAFFTAFMGAVPMIALVTAAIGALAIGLGVFNPGNALSNSITAFFSNFNNLILSFGEYAKYMIENFVTGILANANQLREQGVNLLLSIVTGILTAIPNLLATGIRIVGALVAGLVQILPTLVYQGFMAIGQFIAGLISAIPDVLQGIGNVLMALAEFILTNLPMFIDSGIQLIWNIITGIGGMLGQICNALWELLQSTWNWIISGEALKTFQDVGSKIVDWIKVGLAKTSWGATILGWFGQDADQIIQQAGTDGAETAGNYTSSLNTTIQSSPIDVTSMWNNANVEQNNATATTMGADSASAYIASEQATLDAADVNTDILGDSAAEDIVSATTAGADVGNAYTQTATDSINAGSANVGAAASTVASQLNLTFDNEAVRQSATDFINTIAVVFTEQAPILYQTIGNIGLGTVNEFVGKINENLQQGYAAGVGLISFFKQGIDIEFNAAREGVTAGVNSIIQIFAGLGETFRNYGVQSVSMFGQGFMEATPTAIQTSLSLKTLILEQLRGISEATYGIGRSTIEAFHNGVVATQGVVISDFESLFSKLTSSLTSSMDRMANEFRSIVDSMMNNVNHSLNSGFEDVIHLVSQKRNQVELAFYPAIAAFGEMGAKMMTNLALGIQSKMGDVVDKTSELVSKLKETFESGLGIHSPSDYTTWVAQMMFQGLIRGMTPADIQNWITNVIGDMQTSFEGGKFNAAETMDWLSQQGALDLIAKVTGMDLSAVENATPTAIPAIIQEALKYDGYQGQGGLNGSSMFGARYGNFGAWCVSFVRYCAENVGVPFPATNYVPDVTAWAQANGRWTMTPQPGYAAIFSNRHIELVTDVYPDGTINYIGGNTGNGVVSHRPRRDATGFVALDGGHAVGNTLAAILQMAYNAKYNPTPVGGYAIGTGTMGSIGSMAGINYSPSAGVNQWAGIVQQVLAMLGQPASELNNVLYIIDKESSGNPNPPDYVDYNYIHGYPSKGLMQTIPQTFAQYRNPSLSDNILDPMANIYAAINYMLAKYGSVSATVAQRRGADGRWNGYAVGTRYVPRDMLAMIHEGEAILPANVNPYSNSGGDYLGDLVMSMFERDRGIDGDTRSMTGATYNDNHQDITIEAPITINLQNGEGATEIADNIAEELHKALTRAISVGNAR